MTIHLTFDSASLPRHHKHPNDNSRDGAAAEAEDKRAPKRNFVKPQHYNMMQHSRWYEHIAQTFIHEIIVISNKISRTITVVILVIHGLQPVGVH